jgi:hypothetical protein
MQLMQKPRWRLQRLVDAVVMMGQALLDMQLQRLMMLHHRASLRQLAPEG